MLTALFFLYRKNSVSVTESHKQQSDITPSPDIAVQLKR